MALFLNAIAPHLPETLLVALTTLQSTTPDAQTTLESLVRFVGGGPTSDSSLQSKWAEQQAATLSAISSVRGQSTNRARAREEGLAHSEQDLHLLESSESMQDMFGSFLVSVA
uniref:Uncharacterized protein n=1 Tax=Mycena chlorophos TaxID=658473 RepID=A0ABQ0L258_MYCCL|nr:predicted protein [Mycena chlorophos]